MGTRNRKEKVLKIIINKLIEKNIIDITVYNKLFGAAQRVYLQEFVEKIYYDAENKSIEIHLKTGQMISYTADLKIATISPKLKKKHEIAKEKPQLSKDIENILLTYQIEHYMRTNNLNQKQCASILRITSSRLCQIINTY